jgi:hypothetical protein
MSQITLSPVSDFGQMYVNASSNHTSPTADVIAAAITDKTIREIKETWDSQFAPFNFLSVRA